MWMEIIKVCIVPLLGILTKYFIDFLNAKRNEINLKTNNDIAKKYTDMVYSTVTNCVIATNQTFVDTLKKTDSFDAAAQKEAFDRTMSAVLDVLSSDAKNYIAEATGDINTYLTQLIEAEVNKNKKKGILE